jgi:ATP-dependent Lon protease
MRGMVAFPFMVLPLFIGREKSVAALEAAGDDKMLLLVSQRDEDNEEPKQDDLHPTGVAAQIVQMLKMPDGNVRLVVEGRGRARAVEWTQEEPFFQARIEQLEDIAAEESAETTALMRRLKSDFATAVDLSKTIPPEAGQNAQETETLGALADLVASYLEIPVPARQEILETLDSSERARQVVGLLQNELQVLEVEKELDSQVREGVSDSQREYFLRERLKAIQDKLGATDSSFKDADNLRTRAREADMSDEAREKALSEIDRMERMPPIAPEVGIIRSYVEMLCDLPWNKSSEDRIDIAHAASVLDEDHYALEKIKDRILEFLAVRQLNPDSKGPILCFAGPPGVGKTSIGKSIARALGREFIRVSVGGVHDEAEIRGHRRTYIGAMPGRIIAALRRAKVKNPVFLLDEIDKIGHDHRGDPASALLEALDPEQNNAFTDHYLEVPFDLSQVMFIATANMLDTIPPALRDRMEVLRFAGYTEGEKHAIASKYLVPKQLRENGVTEKNLRFESDGLTEIIRSYTREAGVRNLEREVGTVCRKVARKVAEAQTAKPKAKPKSTVLIKPETLPDFLGGRKFLWGEAQERDEIGVSQGLAWTETGGELMPIEVSLVAGKGNTKLTGNLGAVMKESCEAAMTYARSHAAKLHITGDWTRKHDAHIHVPSGAVPKDGPSAGVAIACALTSALTDVAVRRDVAMTGEISLRGRVLPVGGVKEKILAAHRAGVMTILLPHENERDLDELPTEVRSAMTFHLLRSLDDAIPLALVPSRKIELDSDAVTIAPKKPRAKTTK